MKRTVGIVCVFLVTILACSLFSTPSQVEAPGGETIVAETMQAFPTQVQTANTFTGTNVEFRNLSLTIPPGLATGSSGMLVPPAGEPDVPPWEVTPGHIELTLEGYILPGTFHTPKIYIFPADITSLPPGAVDNVVLLQDVLANPAQLLTDNNMPSIPFFNAGAIFVANENLIEFQNGDGVRMLTQYAQSFAMINNHEFFYHFQGLTTDRQFYLIAILPVSTPSLPADSSNSASLPAGGIPFPDYTDPNADFMGYYDSVTQHLNRLSMESFTPNLSLLDALVASIRVFPP